MSTTPNVRLTSTTSDAEEVTVRRPRRAIGAAPKAPSGSGRLRGWRGLKRLDWRQPHWIEVTYRHGTDPKVLVRCRGREWVYDWDVALLDVVRDICNR